MCNFRDVTVSGQLPDKDIEYACVQCVSFSNSEHCTTLGTVYALDTYGDLRRGFMEFRMLTI